MENLFGDVISRYTRAQAIEDGYLVDMSELIQPSPFRCPVAMTLAAYMATIAAGGHWISSNDGMEDLILAGGQDVQGRWHDVCQCLLHAIRSAGERNDRVFFRVLVDTRGNGRHKQVDLCSQIGPGDNGEPVITILLDTED